MTPFKKFRKYIQPTTIAAFAFLLLIIATFGYTNYKKGLWEKDVRAHLLTILTSKKSQLEKALYSRIYYTRGVASYVSINPEISNNEFAALAKEYIKNDSVISTMALSKNCILNAIYPLEGHEAALGLDLLSHPERKEIVEKTIETGLTFVAGPVELVEGGIAFISYTPIFDRTQAEAKFWGVTDIVIKQKELINEAGIAESEAGFEFSLAGYNGKNDSVFWGNTIVPLHNPVKIKINLPIGNWILSAAPKGGWAQYGDQDKALNTILLISSLIISILVWLFTKALFRLRNSANELKAIFSSLDNIIIDFNVKGEYMHIAAGNDDMLFMPREKLIGKKLGEIFDAEKATFFRDAIHKCIETKKLVEIEYPLIIRGDKHWYSARISYKTSDTVIFNAFEITEKKKQEKLLIDSEERLKKLNRMKNKFFSIIAHDLKGPIGSQKNVINLIQDEYDELSDDDKKELLVVLKNSSENLYALLENLLQWSMSQSDVIEVNRQNVTLYQEVSQMAIQFQPQLELKKISFKNQVDPSDIINADPVLTSTILRNLLSNAIKFTPKNGEIVLKSERLENAGKKSVKISISDNGIGMKPEKSKALFRIDLAESMPGTDNETGNGLGLILCQEFAELQGSKIFVESEFKKGSTFWFEMPPAN